MSATVAGAPGWVADLLGPREPGSGVARVLRALASHPREMSYASTSVAAGLADVNVATVVRAAQVLGYPGWPALRAEARGRYLAGLSTSQVLDEHAGSSERPTWAALGRDVRNLRELAQVLDPDQVARIARIVADTRVTLVLGSGTFAAPGLQLAHLAQTLGHDVRLQRVGGTALLNAASLLTEQDGVVVFHLWRSPQEVLRAVLVAAERGARVVAVSDQSTAELVEAAEELVLVPSEGASVFPSVTASTAVVHAVLAELVALDEDAARAAAQAAIDLWTRSGIFPPDSSTH